jgi:hypothetical protein
VYSELRFKRNLRCRGQSSECYFLNAIPANTSFNVYMLKCTRFCTIVCRHIHNSQTAQRCRNFLPFQLVRFRNLQSYVKSHVAVVGMEKALTCGWRHNSRFGCRTWTADHYLKLRWMFSARRGQDFRRDRYEPLVTVARAPRSLFASVCMLLVLPLRQCAFKMDLLLINCRCKYTAARSQYGYQCGWYPCCRNRKHLPSLFL